MYWSCKRARGVWSQVSDRHLLDAGLTLQFAFKSPNQLCRLAEQYLLSQVVHVCPVSPELPRKEESGLELYLHHICFLLLHHPHDGDERNNPI